MTKYDYNLVVIGAGSAGLVSAYIAATVNAKVALIEKNAMGGDCLNTGCVPSKALLRTAEIMSLIRRGEEFGLKHAHAEVDFPAVMQRVKTIIKTIEPHDSVERYEKLGVDCLHGEATIRDPHHVQIGDTVIRTRAIILATGAKPSVPPIDGLKNIDFLTSDNLWDLQVLPKKLVVLGGGPIGCEMAQAFARLGSEVTIVEMGERLLSIEDKDASDIVHNAFERENIRIKTEHKALRVAQGKLVADNNGNEVTIAFDKILVALGRSPRAMPEWKTLGMKLNDKGLPEVNEYLQTSIPNIYACGDLVPPFQFTHVAAHEAWYACLNALLGGIWRFKVDYSTIAWATFTEPSVARLGINVQEATQRGIAHETTCYELEDLDRAITDSEAEGFVKLLTPPKKDEILGVTIVGKDAANMLSEWVLAKKHGLGVNKVLGTMHIYPTLAEANKYTAGEWKRSHKPEWALKLAQKFFAWRRK
ncbi:MAG: FAD-dependent oxidoreductase [Alphaproteobacteria bacterium]|nr:FAD-dependent oxidoreductase [Alphaproteobacteria bacterium]